VAATTVANVVHDSIRVRSKRRLSETEAVYAPYETQCEIAYEVNELLS
jgi:hypothetical protein